MQRILSMLSRNGIMTGEEIAGELGLTRAAVWKKIEALRSEGWEIRSLGKKGYCLEAGDRIDPVLWQDLLTTRSLGRGEVLFARQMDSTNRAAKQLAAGGAPDGSLCLCEEQTAGRGRMDRTWVSHPGCGLWQSLVLRPSLPPANAAWITLAAALAMAGAVEETCGVSPVIKWPNDLVLGGKKICGILTEMAADPDRVEYVVPGVGLNVRWDAVPKELEGQAGCVEEFAEPAPRRVILAAYLAQMEALLGVLTTEGLSGIMPQYTARSCTLGRPVRVIGHETFEGVAETMDAEGALIVRRSDGTAVRVLAGDVSVRGVMGYV